MSTLEVLRAARALISHPARWAQHDYQAGDRYCAVGAVNVALGREPKDERVSEAEESLCRATSRPSSVPIFNDSHTHAEVLALFDRAIAIEEAKAAEFTVDAAVPVAA